jgi:hypothetical protein
MLSETRGRLDLLEVERFWKSKNPPVLHVRVDQAGNVESGTILDIYEPFCGLRSATEARWNSFHIIYVSILETLDPFCSGNHFAVRKDGTIIDIG